MLVLLKSFQMGLILLHFQEGVAEIISPQVTSKTLAITESRAPFMSPNQSFDMEDNTSTEYQHAKIAIYVLGVYNLNIMH